MHAAAVANLVEIYCSRSRTRSTPANLGSQNRPGQFDPWREFLAPCSMTSSFAYTQKGHAMTTKRKTASSAAPVKVARIYMRVSTEAQDLERQEGIAQAARAAGYYVAGIYREKASGARADRPELLRMIDDLQPGEIVVAEKIDRISRLPLAEAERLVASIRAKGARLSVPGIIDLDELAAAAQGVPRIVLESVQDMLLKLALQMAHDDYEDRRERQRQGIELAKAAGRYAGRTPDTATHARIVALREGGKSIAETARLAGCSQSQVKRVCAMARPAVGDKKELTRS